jgi:trans-2,3-dihydro-3-hydroxyanthranilate isomerase
VSDTLDYAVVDVFTDRAFAGNPLAVVLDADRLSTEQMQSVAREFNLSETTFVLRPTTDEAMYRARSFTPTTELPFAGHPSVGTAWLLVQRGWHEAGTLVQECGAGLVQIVVEDHGAMLTGPAPTQSSPPVYCLPMASPPTRSHRESKSGDPRASSVRSLRPRGAQ